MIHDTLCYAMQSCYELVGGGGGGWVIRYHVSCQPIEKEAGGKGVPLNITYHYLLLLLIPLQVLRNLGHSRFFTFFVSLNNTSATG